MGCRWSYRDGAWNIMAHVPTMQAKVNTHRKNLSNTIDTYFQSSITCLHTDVTKSQQYRFRFRYTFIIITTYNTFFVKSLRNLQVNEFSMEYKKTPIKDNIRYNQSVFENKSKMDIKIHEFYKRIIWTYRQNTTIYMYIPLIYDPEHKLCI